MEGSPLTTSGAQHALGGNNAIGSGGLGGLIDLSSNAGFSAVGDTKNAAGGGGIPAGAPGIIRVDGNSPNQ